MAGRSQACDARDKRSNPDGRAVYLDNDGDRVGFGGAVNHGQSHSVAVADHSRGFGTLASPEGEALSLSLAPLPRGGGW